MAKFSDLMAEAEKELLEEVQSEGKEILKKRLLELQHAERVVKRLRDQLEELSQRDILDVVAER